MSTYNINDGGVNRPMTEKEITEYLNLCAQIPTPLTKKELEDAQTAKQVARQAVLDKLGLTADEAAALFG